MKPSIRRLLSRRGGFTLVEMVISVAILGILLMSLSWVLPTVLKVQRNLTASSRAQTVCSTVLDTVAQELRYGENFSVAGDGASLTYRSLSYGDGAVMAADSRGHLVIAGKAPYADAHYAQLQIALSFRADTGGIEATVSVHDAQGKLLTRQAVTTRSLKEALS